MIEPGKLSALEPGQKRRKLALTFGALERDILGIPEKGSEYRFTTIPRTEYIRRLVRIVLEDPALSPDARTQLAEAAWAQPLDEQRVCNLARNSLLSILGTFPAEWDFVIAPHQNRSGAEGVVAARAFFPGVYVYAEDIRSPFNIGSIFRTAEAMGAENVFISPLCVDPSHQKALRSGMGCVETLGIERKSLDELSSFARERGIPIFALETGGTPIGEFAFPKNGICVIGSEELGVSPAALAAATGGRVTIPMKGLKASLNVGVACGIMMQKWVEALARQTDDEPRVFW